MSWWRLCHSILITRTEVSASLPLHHSDSDSGSTLSLREKKEETYREREREKERNDSSLWGAIFIEAALSPTASHCWCELKESVNQLSPVCVRLPFSEMWRRRGKRGTRAVQHISQEEAWAWVLLCPEYQQEEKKTPTEEESSREKKDLPYAVYYLLLAKLQRTLISKELDVGSHIFPLYLFKCLFEGRVLKSFLCCTIFSTPGGHPAPLLNIC